MQLERSKRAGWFATGDEKVLEESVTILSLILAAACAATIV
jgi:hypothetical protein